MVGASNIEGIHMLGAIILNDLGPVAYDFNFTLRRNETDPFSNIGLVIVDPRGQKIREVTLSESLHIKTRTGIKKTQNVQLTANNDYSKVVLPITIKIDDIGPIPPTPDSKKLPGWAIALIVIGSVAVAGAAGYFGWRYWKIRQGAVLEPEIKKSLLE